MTISEIKYITTQKAPNSLGEYKSETKTRFGDVNCEAVKVFRGYKSHYRFKFKLNGKVISKAKLELLISA